MLPLTRIDVLEALLQAHRPALGSDFMTYRNHTYRVANICLALTGASASDAVEKVGIAAGCHDLGIWTSGTFDYLQPSIALAEAHLARTGYGVWTAEIDAMILEHHKCFPYRGSAGRLVEPFRQADWIDVTYGLVRFGLPRTVLRPIFDTWPDAGFHKRLLQLAIHRLRTHPLSPLPMMRL